jgi:prepilin-type N-terminal cleavage/methylation domain-containing protein
MKHKTQKHGFTLIELLVVMSIIALLLSILMPALGRARAEAMLAKDQSQVKAIYSGFAFWAPSHKGRYPIPGLEQRMVNPVSGKRIKGRGPEDLRMNDHASMLSMCIMQSLFTPDILFAPTEASEYVAPIEEYDYDQYNATETNMSNPDVNEWTFWDRAFTNDLESNCHNSYGIIPITGKRKIQNWGISTNSPMSFAIVGTRGPAEGIQSPTSTSNLFHGIERDWKGVISFGDGHNEILETFYPMSSTYIRLDGGSEPDNIFEEADGDPSPAQAEDADYMPGGFKQGQGADIILTHVKLDSVDGGPQDGKGGACSEYLHD